MKKAADHSIQVQVGDSMSLFTSELQERGEQGG